MILVYTAFFTPVAIYFMRSFFQAIPRDLEEAAQVDGCTPFWAFVRIVLPNAAPGLTATFVYAFLFAWDELLFVASLTEHNAETLPLGIRLFIGNYSQYYGQLMAAGVISTLPVVVAFFAAQRWLVRGITAGAVKG
jgi:multiple sugar transport system permease protein